MPYKTILEASGGIGMREAQQLIYAIKESSQKYRVSIKIGCMGKEDEWRDTLKLNVKNTAGLNSKIGEEVLDFTGVDLGSKLYIIIGEEQEQTDRLYNTDVLREILNNCKFLREVKGLEIIAYK